MAKTLTDLGIQKIGRRFVDSIDHANYTLNGEPKTVPPFRTMVNGSDVRVYIYFNDTVIGDVANAAVVPVKKGMPEETRKELDKYFHRDKDKDKEKEKAE